MGTDAKIWVQVKDLKAPLGADFYDKDLLDVRSTDKDSPEGATHEISGLGRWGSEGVSDNWPFISSILFTLFGTENVEKIWYGDEYLSNIRLTTIEELMYLTKEFLVSRRE